jgi:hypothetical protein
MYKDSAGTSQETHCVFNTNTNQLMLLMKTVAVYCKNRTEHTNTLCGQKEEFYYVKADGTYSDHWALNG